MALQKKNTVKKEIPIGTIRIKVKDLKTYEKTANSWKKSKQTFPNIQNTVKLFKAHNSLKVLIDTKNPKFLKGQVSNEGQIQGARINILPDGTIIDKAYSLFAKHLTFHDQTSEDHWDVLFQNKGGTYAYCYSLEKKAAHRKRKYKKVHQFAKVYPILTKAVTQALNNSKDELAVPMFTLLNTHMRIGNETYFKAHDHKGLTTLTKKDISIKGKNVSFKYFGKDGVPRDIKKEFPTPYVSRLQKRLNSIKRNDFVFATKSGKPLPEVHFKKAFVQYCGKEFYPHIVRSHYATNEVREFLRHKRKTSKAEVNTLFLSIASELGHKKYLKKEHEWKNNYSVTVNHYIQPELVDKVKSIIR